MLSICGKNCIVYKGKNIHHLSLDIKKKLMTLNLWFPSAHFYVIGNVKLFTVSLMHALSNKPH